MSHVFAPDSDYVADLDEVERHLAAHREFLTCTYSHRIFLASGRKDPRTGGAILARDERARSGGS